MMSPWYPHNPRITPQRRQAVAAMAVRRPLVSVVMPVRNGETYIESAARSVLEQQGVDLELVVIDDGSSDNTRERLEKLNDPRIRIIDGPEQGVAAAMNAGIAEARGLYFARCDGDDLYESARLWRQVRYLETNGCFGAVCGRFQMIDARSRIVHEPQGAGLRDHEITRSLRQGIVDVHFCTYLARTEHVRATGGFRSFFKTGSDIDFQLLLCEQTRVAYDPHIVYRYRLHDDSITHRHAPAFQMANERLGRALEQQRRERGQDDLQLERPIDKPTPTYIEGPTASEQAWQCRWGEVWREHTDGFRLRAARLGLETAMQRPMRRESWKRLAVLLVKTGLSRSPVQMVGQVSAELRQLQRQVALRIRQKQRNVVLGRGTLPSTLPSTRAGTRRISGIGTPFRMEASDRQTIAAE